MESIVRERRIDTIRGIVIFLICTYHFTFFIKELSYTGIKFPSFSTVSLSSAAEVFVLLSGYMVGYVYFQRNDAAQRLWKRAASIYLWNALAFLCILPLWLKDFPPLMEVTRATGIMDNPLEFFTRFFTLREAPYLLDILQLYVQILLIIYILYILLKLPDMLTLALSAAAYLGAQIYAFTHQGSALPLFFLPAWQFPFIIALLLGKRSAHLTLFRYLESHSKARFVILAAIAISIIVYRILPPHLCHAHFLTIKNHLGIVRLIHAFLMFGGLAIIAIYLERYGSRLTDQTFGRLGRYSLETYSLSIPLTYYAAYIWETNEMHMAGYLMAEMLLVLTLWGATFMWPHISRRTQKSAGK